MALHVRIVAVHDTDRWSKVTGVVGSTGHFVRDYVAGEKPEGYVAGYMTPDAEYRGVYTAESLFIPYFVAVQYEVLA